MRGLTVVVHGGTRIPVTTAGGTHVVVPRASLGQLRAGVTTAALGHAEPGRTLSVMTHYGASPARGPR
jgi:hypothetical protein